MRNVTLTNISLGGLITHYGSTTLKLIDTVWKWKAGYIFSQFGWKAILAIVIATFSVYAFYKKEFRKLPKKLPSTHDKVPTLPPWWVVGVHLLVLAGVIATSDQPFIAYTLFMFLLGFYQATLPYQTPPLFKEPLMIGFFIASIIVLGSLQDWWISPIFAKLEGVSVALFTFLFSAINQNQTLAFIATHISTLDAEDTYYFTIGMTAAGGLTFISNVPNMIAYKILAPHFGGEISLKRHFLHALFPAIIALLIFIVLY
jgi:hypothetical protein